MTPGLHDNPALFPHLPPAGHETRLAEVIDGYAPAGSEFRAAWEYVLSHQLSDTEGSAFWHGVGIQREATTAAVRAELEPAIDRVRQLHSQDEALLAAGKWCPGCGHETPCPTIRALNGSDR